MAATQKTIRAKFDTDALIVQCRMEARAKIALATRPDGSLDWSKLPKLVTVNPKLEKVNGEDKYVTAGFQLAPAWASGYNTCAGATIGCASVCLFGAGHGQRHMIHDGKHIVWIARITRTILFFEHREQFMMQAIKEMQAFKRKAIRQGIKSAFRPNVLSDIDWQSQAPWVFSQGIDRVYDYTKVAKRVRKNNSATYHLTLSRTETTDDKTILDTVKRGVNVAVVFNVKKGAPLPDEYLGVPVIDADVTDNRFNDPVGVIAGLREKKTGKSDQSGFVVQL